MRRRFFFGYEPSLRPRTSMRVDSNSIDAYVNALTYPEQWIGEGMDNPLTRKLELFGSLPSRDRQLLDDITRRPRPVGPREDLIREGEVPSDVHLVLQGVACRYKNLADGGRQIFAYMVPGDFCDLNVFILKAMDHSIGTLSQCSMIAIPREAVLEMSQRPAIARACWWATLVDEAVLREWLVNLGQRSAEHRIAHLFCELHLRFKSIGLANGGNFEMPITQTELGETMGLSTVHVNRSLQSLRAQNLIFTKGRSISIPDVARLHEISGFNSNYLHLNGGKPNL